MRRRRRDVVPAGGPSSSEVGDRGSSSGLGTGSQVAASCGSARAGDGAALASATARASATERLGLGHHRGLVLGVGVEQLVERREVVEVAGSGSQAAASCGSARAGDGDTEASMR